MELMKTEKDVLSDKDILKYISDYEVIEVPDLAKLWRYYTADNATIQDRKAPDPNNPDNKTPVPYGRKIVNTLTGYAYRPRYITYKTEDEAYMTQLQDTFNLNHEHIKTSRAGRNTAIFGAAYEVMYVEGDRMKLQRKAEPRFFPADPRELILLYDYSPEPLKKMAIRYYKINPNLYKVEMYYGDRIQTFDRTKTDSGEWRLTSTGEFPNFYDAVPVVSYYFGDEMLGVIKPVIPLIDDYDVLVSDSINEFDRFAHAYLLLVKFALTNPAKDKDPSAFNRMLQNIKRRRVFENLPDKDAVSFLTKDIPTDFMTFMSELIRNEIHSQSHVPDFTSKTFSAEISGVAVQRLLFDFENVVSSAEADFDLGLQERLNLINVIYAKAGRPVGDINDVTISHKRNLPVNLKEFADTAVAMLGAGFSRYLVADIMPDDIIPDVQEELDRQDEERAGMVDVDMFGPEDTADNADTE